MFLITGSQGQLGQSLKGLYSAEEAFFTDKTSLDISCKDSLNNFIKDKKISGIINCAAYNFVDKAESDKSTCDKINHIGIKNLAAASQELQTPIIHISTDYVFDGKETTPYNETTKPSAINYYGLSKSRGETALLDNAYSGAIIRTSWLYSEFSSNFLKTMYKLTKERKHIDVVYDQISTPTYACDLAQIIKKLLTTIKPNQKEIYHFSNEGVASWYDFAYEINSISNHNCKIKPVTSNEYKQVAQRPKFSVLGKEKIKNHLNIEIQHWKEALKKCMTKLS